MKHVVIVGGGFAGLSAAHVLSNDGVRVTLIDKNNYSQFKPLLYQVATSALFAEDAASVFRTFFRGKRHVDIKMGEVVSVDPVTLTVKTNDGHAYQGDYLILSAGSVVNFFDVPGAERWTFPLYTLDDAERLRSRVLAAFEEADTNPKLIEEGALNFVIVGAGPTGTETAGSLADLFYKVMPREFSDVNVKKAGIYLIDHSPHLLRAFSARSQAYASRILQERGVKLKLGLSVKEVSDGHVALSDGSIIKSRTVIWAGGLQGGPIAAHCGVPQAQGGRIPVKPDLSVEGFPNFFVLGDLAEIKDKKGDILPQLASVAQQSGYWAAKAILADLNGQPRGSFHYKDKGIMAMIGRNAAIAEIGPKRVEMQGTMAFFAWLFVHAALLNTLWQRMGALFEWAWDYFGDTRVEQVLDRKKGEK